MKASVILIGCGNMGFAMLSGWVINYPELSIYAIDPDEGNRVRAHEKGAQTYPDISKIPGNVNADLLILAVKPAMVGKILAEFQAQARSGTTFVSVAAGVTTKSMQDKLPAKTPIIRCMPNTPAAIGEGMMALYKNEFVSSNTADFAEKLFRSNGEAVWLEAEELMDSVTAISGSGPAYIFHFAEALTNAGINLGLPRETALLLANQTIKGAGLMVAQSDLPASTLRENVTSPNGTTAAALDVLMRNNGLTDLLLKATEAAHQRSVELGRSD